MFSAKYVMKCDDDTFVRLDSVISEVKKVPSDRSLYIGNMNFHQRLFRQGKWAVTYEVKHVIFCLTGYWMTLFMYLLSFFFVLLEIQAKLFCYSDDSLKM